MSDNNSPKNTQKTEEFYKKFKTRLEENHDFPQTYIFKFVIESDKGKLTEIHQIFDELHHTFRSKESSNGKYVSCTFSTFVLSADQVIDIYKKVAQIEGVVML